MDFGFEDGAIKSAFSSAFWQLANNNKDREKLKYKPHSLLSHTTGEWLPEAAENQAGHLWEKVDDAMAAELGASRRCFMKLRGPP